MAFPSSGQFDYLLGGRPLATLAKDTGNLDYWLGGRPIAAQGGIVYQYLRPISDIAANGWLASTGPDLYAMLDETVANDGDYIYESE